MRKTQIIQPFGERILVKILTPEEVIAGGLLVQPVAKEKSNRGIVVATGEGSVLENGQAKPLSVHVGDEVFFQAGMGIDYHTEKEDYKILHVRDVLGKFVDKENE